MGKDSEKNNNILTAEFKVNNLNSANKNMEKSPENRQSNPIFRRLFKLVYSELTRNKKDYKSFSKFSPKDLI